MNHQIENSGHKAPTRVVEVNSNWKDALRIQEIMKLVAGVNLCYLIIFCVLAVKGEFLPCETPYGLSGSCRKTADCDSLQRLAKKNSRSIAEQNYLHDSICGQANGWTLVCCPDETVDNGVQMGIQSRPSVQCQIPSGEDGDCMPIEKCPDLYYLARNTGYSHKVVDFLQRSRCGNIDTQINVCCKRHKADGPVDKPKAPIKVVSFKPCTTSIVKDGQCMSLNSCSNLLDLELNGNIFERNKFFILQNMCGYEIQNPLFCCPKMEVPTQQTPAEASTTETPVLPIKECRTPNGVIGECLDKTACPPINKLFEYSGKLSQKQLIFLDDSKCDDNVRYCCPKTLVEEEPKTTTPAPNIAKSCQTPNGVAGTCVSIIECYSLMEIMNKTEFLENDMNYLKASFCADSDQFPIVCCPERPDETILPLPPYCGIATTKRAAADTLTQTEFDEYPWTALLVNRNPNNEVSYVCGGTLIHERYVITAAHCLEDEPPVISVRLGLWATRENNKCRQKKTDTDDKRCAPPYMDINVDKRIIHPEYNDIDNDIVLLRLAAAITPTRYISPICLRFDSKDNSDIADGTSLAITGWGAATTMEINDFKMKTTVTLQNLKECINLYSINATINLSANHICVAGKTVADSIIGDTGGALMSLMEIGKVKSYFLIGINTMSTEYLLSQGFPAIYTQIGAHLEWIKEEIESD